MPWELLLRTGLESRLLALPEVVVIVELGLVGALGIVALVRQELLVRRGEFPEDRELGHDGLLPGSFCVLAHAMILHQVLGLWVLLARLVPGGGGGSRRATHSQ